MTRRQELLELIVEELKEMTLETQSRKLRTYTATNPTRLAVFEYDCLIRSIYTLKYLCDRQMEHNIRRS